MIINAERTAVATNPAIIPFIIFVLVMRSSMLLSFSEQAGSLLQALSESRSASARKYLRLRTFHRARQHSLATAFNGAANKDMLVHLGVRRQTSKGYGG